MFQGVLYSLGLKGREKYLQLVELWDNARVNSKAVAKFVDETWTYFKRNVKGLYKWIFTIINYMDKGMYLVFSVGDRHEKTFKETKAQRKDG